MRKKREMWEYLLPILIIILIAIFLYMIYKGQSP